MGTVHTIRGAHLAPKASQSKMETIIINQPMVNNWRIPPFQRPLRLNCKVQAVTEAIKASEVVEGVLTLGALKNDAALYIVDGQHRIEAFRLSGLKEAIADVRVVTFLSMAEMAEEFVQLNTALVKMRPDDILRGLEATVPALREISKRCEFVGYGQIKRNGSGGPIVSMSALLRCWGASQYEVPSSSSIPGGVIGLAQGIDQDSLNNLLAFLQVAYTAWARDPEYYRLWGGLNMTISMWLWRRLVIDKERSGPKRYISLDIPKFKKCLMALSNENDYLSWLHARTFAEGNRAPCYTRMKAIFVRRLAEDSTSAKKPTLPAPAWAAGR